MGGHTIFHLAATQDNAEVLSFLLLNCPSADVNILTADGRGMSPLHCAIRAESMETFDVLISHREVDVNAVLKARVSLARPPWTGLTLHSWWEVKNSEPYRFYKASCESDTPLHLAIRCCSSLTLRKMVMKFCNHPRFKPSIYNESGVLPLDLAWLRSSCSLQFGNSSVHLHSVLDMLERQPGNEPLMNDVNVVRGSNIRRLVAAAIWSRFRVQQQSCEVLLDLQLHVLLLLYVHDSMLFGHNHAHHSAHPAHHRRN
ncbi:hypothetical protein Mapa_006158 [Marchantia paleacea]|nr:hypothetical protein Mapa_006158 [Marchantia paleacea]